MFIDVGMDMSLPSIARLAFAVLLWTNGIYRALVITPVFGCEPRKARNLSRGACGRGSERSNIA